MRAVAQPVWLSSGTAALIAALEVLGARGKAVALPPNVCPNVLAAIRAVDAMPWFVDIEPERQGMDPAQLSRIVDQVACVIAVHAYGVPCQIKALAALTDQAGIALIEDCAPADGAFFDGQPVGSFGDIAVFSFGTGKIIDAGGGGFALVRAPALQQAMCAHIASWPAGDHGLAANLLSTDYKRLYNRFYPEVPPVEQRDFGVMLAAVGAAFADPIHAGREQRLRQAREALGEKVAARREKYALYAAELAGSGLVIPVALPEGSAPWRFNALLPAEIRDSVFRSMLAQGQKISTWYPDITRFLAPGTFRSDHLDVARHFDRRLINLWLDDGESAEQIYATVATLLRNCREAAEQPAGAGVLLDAKIEQ